MYFQAISFSLLRDQCYRRTSFSLSNVYPCFDGGGGGNRPTRRLQTHRRGQVYIGFDWTKRGITRAPIARFGRSVLLLREAPLAAGSGSGRNTWPSRLVGGSPSTGNFVREQRLPAFSLGGQRIESTSGTSPLGVTVADRLRAFDRPAPKLPHRRAVGDSSGSRVTKLTTEIPGPAISLALARYLAAASFTCYLRSRQTSPAHMPSKN